MKLSTRIFLLAATLMLAALPALASPRSTKMAGTIAKGQFYVAGGEIVNGVTLKDGDYNVVASDSTLSFYSGKKLVAQAPIEWKDGSEKSRQNAIVSDSGKVQEVRFKGRNRSAVVQQ